MPQNKNFHNYLTQYFNHNFKFQTIDAEITMSIINKLSPKTSYGVYEISTKLLKTIKVTLVKPITLIINQMHNTGIFPNKQKIAKIIHNTQENETLFTNYRPISLLPAIFKIFEKVIFKQLYQFFQEKRTSVWISN